MTKTTHCLDCKLDLTTKNFAIHLKSKKHLANSSSKPSIPENKVVKPADNDETDGEDDDDDLYDADDEGDEGVGSGYLDDFDVKLNKIERPQPQSILPKTPQIVSPSFQQSNDKMRHLFQQRQTQLSAPQQHSYKVNDNMSVKSDEIFSSKATPILGKSYRENLAKIRQYKQLFKTELKSFKIKKGATSKDLENYIVEMQAVLDCDSADNFTSDALYHVLQVVESVSGNTKNYNLTGLTEILKNNIQFNQLIKILAAKYSVFSQVPPEYILAFTLASTAYVVVSQNRIKAALNEPVTENMPLKS
jgi:hypothetical protein